MKLNLRGRNWSAFSSFKKMRGGAQNHLLDWYSHMRQIREYFSVISELILDYTTLNITVNSMISHSCLFLPNEKK